MAERRGNRTHPGRGHRPTAVLKTGPALMRYNDFITTEWHPVWWPAPGKLRRNSCCPGFKPAHVGNFSGQRRIVTDAQIDRRKCHATNVRAGEGASEHPAHVGSRTGDDTETGSRRPS